MKNKQAVVAWLKVFIWAALIFFVSGIPSLTTRLGIWDLMMRKTAHIVEYAILFFLFAGAFRATWPHFSLRKIISLSFVLSVLYAVSDEWHQSFVPGRVGSAMDVGIDSLGVIFASFYYGFKNR